MITRATYDYNMILLNSELKDEEILPVLSHELGHEYFALNTNLGQLCWLLNNLSYYDKQFYKSYDYVHKLTNKNEEKFCVLFEICTLFAEKDFQNIDEVIMDKAEYLKYYLSKDYIYFMDILKTINKENYNEMLILFRTIFSNSIISELPNLTIEELINGKKLQSKFDKNNINPKSKLKEIIKYCKLTTYSNFKELTDKIVKQFKVDNKLPEKIGNIFLKDENVFISYKSEANPIVKKYKEDKELQPLLVNVTITAFLCHLLIVLAEEQKKRNKENPIDRVLFFKEENFNLNADVIINFKQQQKYLSCSNQVTFMIPYNTEPIRNVDIRKVIDPSFSFKKFKVIGNQLIYEQRKLTKSNNAFVFDNISINDIKKLYSIDNSSYLQGGPNIIVRLNHQTNNMKYINNIRQTFSSLRSEWINIFVCNNQSQASTLIDSINLKDTNIIYKYYYGVEGLSVFEINYDEGCNIRLFLFINCNDVKQKIDLGNIEEKPSINLNILVTLFLDYTFRGDIVHRMDNKKLFI